MPEFDFLDIIFEVDKEIPAQRWGEPDDVVTIDATSFAKDWIGKNLDSFIEWRNRESCELIGIALQKALTGDPLEFRSLLFKYAGAFAEWCEEEITEAYWKEVA